MYNKATLSLSVNGTSSAPQTIEDWIDDNYNPYICTVHMYAYIIDITTCIG